MYLECTSAQLQFVFGRLCLRFISWSIWREWNSSVIHVQANVRSFLAEIKTKVKIWVLKSSIVNIIWACIEISIQTLRGEHKPTSRNLHNSSTAVIVYAWQISRMDLVTNSLHQTCYFFLKKMLCSFMLPFSLSLRKKTVVNICELTLVIFNNSRHSVKASMESL